MSNSNNNKELSVEKYEQWDCEPDDTNNISQKI